MTEYQYHNLFGYRDVVIDPNGNTTQRHYDYHAGNLLGETISRTDEGEVLEESTAWDYDFLNRIVTTTNALGQLSEKRYDDFGNLAAETDTGGLTTAYEYDAYQRLILTRYPDGSQSRMAYDAEGNVISETDRTGQTTTHRYDALNRRIATDYADGRSSATEYDAVGNIRAETDENGQRTEYEYDPANRRILMRDALGYQTYYGYDANDNLVSVTDANGHTTRFEYDAADRRVKTIYPDNTTELTRYGANGLVAAKTDQNGQLTQFAYDFNGNLLSVTDALQQLTSFAYDEADNKVSFTNARNNTWTWRYDALGRQRSHHLPGDYFNNSPSYSDYDLNGNVIRETYFHRHKERLYDYDRNNRRIAAHYELNKTDTFETETTTFDAEGNRLSATDLNGGYREWRYDARHRLISDLKANGDLLEYGYDNVGNRTLLRVTPSGAHAQTTTFAFDALNRLIRVTDSDNRVTHYRYDAVGNPIEIRYPNGVRTVKEYNSLNRLIRLASTNAQGQLLTEFLYTLDPAGHRTRIEETVSGRIADYQYDALYRLTEEAISDPLNGDYLANYDYDEVGNRTRKVVNGQVFEQAYHPDNLLGPNSLNLYWKEDGQGRLWKYTHDGKQYTLKYNGKNELKQLEVDDNGNVIETYDYAYDLDGIRTQTTDVFTGQTTDYLIDHNRDYAQVLLETDSEASIAYLYGDDLIRQSQNSTEERYYLYDGLGSTQALTDETGQVTDDYTYEAFGQLLSHTGSSNNTYLFAGEQFDPSSQSYRLRARNYFAPSGRFTRMDDWAGSDCTPITLNKYVYGNANPVTYTDPSGYLGIVGIMGGRFVSVSPSTVMFGYRATSTGKKAVNAYNGIVKSLCRSGKSISKYFKLNRKHFEEHHSHPKYLGGDPNQELIDVASLLHIRLHSLINYIHRLNKLKIKTQADFNSLSNYKKAKSLLLLLKTTEAFDEACSVVRGYQPIAPVLRGILGK